MRLVLHSISAVSTAFSASSCEGSPHKMFRMKQRLANAIMDEQDPAREPRLLLVSYYLASPPLAPIMSNAADLHNELSRVAPQASHQLRRACEIMWRLQHGISLKTAKGPFVLCPCHCSFKTSAMPTASKKTPTSETLPTQLGYIASTSGLACHSRPCLPAGPCWATCTSGLAGPSARPALLASFRVLT